MQNTCIVYIANEFAELLIQMHCMYVGSAQLSQLAEVDPTLLHVPDLHAVRYRTAIFQKLSRTHVE